MKVLVTGGSGFLGKRVCAELEDRGWEPVVFDASTGVDVRNGHQVKEAMKDCRVAVHLAGVLGTSELFDKAHEAVDVNVHGTLNVLEAVQSVAGGYVGITMPAVWENVYQATKGCGKALASAWHRHHGLRVSHVRAFNVFGEGQKVKGVQKVVPTFATRAWGNAPLPVWGDGTQTMDLVYVGDVARMLVDAMTFGDDEVFDAGTGVATTVNELAEFVLDYTHSQGGVDHLPMRKGEHETKIVARGDGWDDLGWHPEFRQADLNRTLDWYQADRP